MKLFLIGLIVSAAFCYNSVTAQLIETRVAASDSSSFAQFGKAVAISGDYIIVGAQYDYGMGQNSGAAYIFHRDSLIGDWIEQTKLNASDAAGQDRFGVAVSISGNFALIGAWADDDKGDRSGSAYIFERNGTNWMERSKLTASDGAPLDHFGESVSVSGNYAIVGSNLDDNNGLNSGSAYIFKQDSLTGNWTELTKITASDADADDRFGYSVSMDGDYAIVGSYFNDDSGSNSGSAYIFKRDSVTDIWEEQTKLIASDAAASNNFGWSVAVAGSDAIVGTRVSSSTKGAYIFKRNGTSWMEEAKLAPINPTYGDQYLAVSIQGNFAIVGAPNHDTIGIPNRGAAYLFTQDSLSGNWVEHFKLTASDGAANDEFGSSVFVEGTTAIAGAPLVGTDQGAAYIYDGIDCVPGLLGDVNADGLVNSTDALIILSFDAGVPLSPQLQYRINIGFGDGNREGLTNSTDSLIILSFDAGLPIPFPVGDPVCL